MLGGQLRIADRKYRYDGSIEKAKLCFEYLGCWAHPHTSCKLKKAKPPPPDVIASREAYQLEREEYARMNGWMVISIRECVWLEQRRTDQRINNYLKQHLLINLPRRMSTETLLHKVCDQSFFGFIEVSLEIPEGSACWERCREVSKNFSIY